MEGHAEMDMSVAAGGTLWQRLRSPAGFTAVSHVYVMEWAAILRDIVIGLVAAGALAAWVPDSWWRAIFLTHHPTWAHLWGPIVGPLVAVLSFVCSIGNVPLAAVLWNGGISFGGVIAFIFADLIVLPIVAIYRKYYGGRFAARIVALMFVTMAAAALAIDGIFSAAGLVPSTRLARADVFQPVALDYKLVLNLLGLVVFAALVALTVRRGATDPSCGMTIDRAKALTSVRDGVTYYFCGEGCRRSFESGAATHHH
jgi:uncharacterized membrane protein YraQ (UPF0718 family)/YHS domain-containing protein